MIFIGVECYGCQQTKNLTSRSSRREFTLSFLELRLHLGVF